MSAIFPPAMPIDPGEVRPVVWGNGTGALMLGHTGFLSITTPLDARLLAVKLTELANAMEAAQREKEAAK